MPRRDADGNRDVVSAHPELLTGRTHRTEREPQRKAGRSRAESTDIRRNGALPRPGCSCAGAVSSITQTLREQLPVRLDPGEQLSQTALRPDPRPPAELLLDPADIADVDALVARPPAVETQLDRPPQPILETGDELDQRERVVRPAADVVGAPGRLLDRVDGGFVGGQKVAHVQHVADLAPSP